MKINIGIVDDHQLFLKSLSVLIESFPTFNIVIDALNGEGLLAKLESATTLPDILLLDVNMPVMDGARTAAAINLKYPEIKMVALSMKDDDVSVIKMIKAGCSAA